eukprot:scaffold364522_cov25-Prasinocladus_malaysianus.AAC.1
MRREARERELLAAYGQLGDAAEVRPVHHGIPNLQQNTVHCPTSTLCYASIVSEVYFKHECPLGSLKLVSCGGYELEQ